MESAVRKDRVQAQPRDRRYLDYAGLLPLAVVECPIEFPRMRVYQMWHGRQQASPAHKWLRGVLKDVAAATVGRH